MKVCARRLRPGLWDIPVVLAVLALAWLSLPGGGSRGETQVEVRCGRAPAERFSPAALLEAPRQYSHNGYTLTLTAEQTPRGIAVAAAASTCPGGDCVRTGAIRLRGESIVCLPAEIVITLTGGEGQSAVDAVTG